MKRLFVVLVVAVLAAAQMSVQASTPTTPPTLAAYPENRGPSLEEVKALAAAQDLTLDIEMGAVGEHFGEASFPGLSDVEVPVTSTSRTLTIPMSANGDVVSPQTGVCVVIATVGYPDSSRQAIATIDGISCTNYLDPRNVTVEWFDSNINHSPSSARWYSRKRDSFACPGCVYRVSWSHTVTRTSRVMPRIRVTARTGEQGETTFPSGIYNDRGRPYPTVISGKYGGAVPFRMPLNGWHFCEQYPTPPTCWRDPSFRQNNISDYIYYWWTFPQDPYEAHHIAPLQFGGGNVTLINGVLLHDTDHATFTTWWSGFNPRWW